MKVKACNLMPSCQKSGISRLQSQFFRSTINLMFPQFFSFLNTKSEKRNLITNFSETTRKRLFHKNMPNFS